MKPSKLLSFLTIIPCLLLMPSCSGPILYPPSCDLNPVLALPLPDHIATLADCPRDETHTENGINTHAGRRQPDGIKEMFVLKKSGAEYRFILFFDDRAAIRWDASEKEFNSKRHIPVYREITKNGCSGRLYYTEQPRADPEGGSFPMGYYVALVNFRLHNLFVCVQTRQDGPWTDTLNIAVRDLAQMLGKALTDANNVPHSKAYESMCHLDLGIAADDRGKLDEAISEYCKAIELDPNNSEAHHRYGLALARRHKFGKAVTQFRRAITLKPDYADAHYHLGLALARQRRFTEAIPEYRKALELKPDYEEARQHLNEAMKMKDNDR